MAAEPYATLLALARALGWPGYLVGGCVRDRLVGRASRDLDLVGPGAGDFARAAARPLRATVVPLDLERGTVRLVGRHGDILDFSEQAGALAADLAARDFTINAIACDLDSWSTGEPRYIDPLSGRRDLDRRLIRAAGVASLRADPLRCLRAYRLAAALEFTVEPRTAELVREAAPGLAETASERILAEWLPLLSEPSAAAALGELARSGVLAVLLPGPCQPDAVAAVDELGGVVGLDPRDEATALVRWAALMGPREEPDPALIERFALSRAQRQRLHTLRRPWSPDASDRGLAELVFERGEASPGVVVLAAVRHALGAAALAGLAPALERVLVRARARPLVTGDTLRETLGIPPGPAYQRILRAARLAQLAGEVEDASAALAVAREEAAGDR